MSGLAAVPPGRLGGVAAGTGAAANPAVTPARLFSAPVPPNFDVSDRPGNEAENTIAANPLDPRNVAAMTCPIGRKNLDGLFLGVSFDGGVTWTRRLYATGARWAIPATSGWPVTGTGTCGCRT